MIPNKICDLLKIDYPIIQGGMVWVSGAKLASAVSNAGGLGLIGAGSMNPDILELHLKKAALHAKKPIGINLPLLYSRIDEQIDLALQYGIRIFFTSAGSPKNFTKKLKDLGCIVVHVTSSPELAKKCEDAGVDAIVCEGFEAGGHNGRDEITTMSLIPQVKHAVKIPVIAAGGIYSGRSMLAAMALGADGVQMGTRFLMTEESSAHDLYKKQLLLAKPSSTKLLMRKTVPVRLFENVFSKEIEEIENQFLGDTLKDKLNAHLGHGRAKIGMLEGDLIHGELEVGQIISDIKDIPKVNIVMKNILDEFEQAKVELARIQFNRP